MNEKIILLTQRQISIAEFLSGSQTPVNIKELAKIFHISTRSVYYDLDRIELWSRMNHLFLLRDPNKGIVLRGEENSQIRALPISGKVMQQEDRVSHILSRLLTCKDFIIAEQFAEELGVSRNTVIKDINQLKKDLAHSGLFLHGMKSHGFSILGDEGELRKFITELIINSTTTYELIAIILRGKEISSLKPDIQLLFPDVSLLSIKNAVKFAKQKYDFWIPDIDYVRFIIYQAICIKRISNQKLICYEDTISKEIREFREYSIAQIINDFLGMEYALEIGENEIINSAKMLLHCNIKTLKQDTVKHGKDFPLQRSVEKMIHVLMEYTSFDSNAYIKLKLALYEHLKLTIKQMQFGIVNHNELLDKIKINYPQSYGMAEKMAASFSRSTNIVLPESEIGFIAMHVAVYLEVVEKQTSAIKVIVICSSGKGAANVLSKRLQTSFPDLLIKGTYSVFDVEEKEEVLDDVDLIISTIDYTNNIKPVIKVSPLLMDSELYLIEGFMHGDRRQLGKHPSKQKDYMFSYLYDRLEEMSGIEMNEELREKLEDISCYLDENFIFRSELENGLENINDLMAMIILRSGDLIKKLENKKKININDERVKGLFIHLLMSIARWEKGSFSEDTKLDKYKKIDKEMYSIVRDYLEEIGDQINIQIPESEIVAIMRYLI